MKTGVDILGNFLSVHVSGMNRSFLCASFKDLWYPWESSAVPVTSWMCIDTFRQACIEACSRIYIHSRHRLALTETYEQPNRKTANYKCRLMVKFSQHYSSSFLRLWILCISSAQIAIFLYLTLMTNVGRHAEMEEMMYWWKSVVMWVMSSIEYTVSQPTAKSGQGKVIHAWDVKPRHSVLQIVWLCWKK